MPEEIQTPAPTQAQTEVVQPAQAPVATVANPEEKAKEILKTVKGRNWLKIIIFTILVLIVIASVYWVVLYFIQN